jgi:uncharacterized protein YyaL (SSP411 family)
MISAFAKGAQILGEPRYEQEARHALDFLHAKLWREGDSILLRRYREGEAGIEGFLDDYAFLALALLDMYETSFEAADLSWAIRLAERARDLFEDREQGGFFSTPRDSALILRLKDDYDGAEPSGNSGMIMALLRLSRMTGREDFRSSAERVLRAFGRRMGAAPTALPQMLAANLLAQAKPIEIVLAGARDDAMLKIIRHRFLPNAIVMRADQSPVSMPPVDGRSTAYVCENYSCRLPASTADALAETLTAM